MKPSATLRRRIIKWGAILFLAAAALAFAAIQCAKPLLFIETKSNRCDAVVVLGGEAGDRVFRALEVFRATGSPRIVVSGSGDCYLIRDRLALAGVPENKIILETDSRNTKENAEYAVKLLRQLDCKRVIVVTSWYHSRRALACFEHFSKDIDYFSAPAYHGLDMDGKPGKSEVPAVLHEYGGITLYFLRNGISPFLIKKAK